MVASELPEKPLMEHVYDLLDTVRKILAINITSIVLLLVLPTPHLLPEKYAPLTFYIMEYMRKVVLLYEENIVLKPIAKVFGVNSSRVILISHGWFDSLTAAVITSAMVTIIALAPVSLYFLYKFVEPGLYPHERRIIRKYLIVIAVLFTAGALYGFYVVVPLTFMIALWIADLSGAAPLFSIQDFYQNILLGSLAIGVFFTFPLLVLALGKIGVVTYATLRNNWRYVLFLTLALLAILTPDPTPTSALALGLPFVGLYFLSMWLLRKTNK